MTPLALQLDHPANVLQGFRDIVLTDHRLTFQADHPARGLIVVHSSRPLLMESAANVTATLRPGWDGSLGYKLYGLEVQVAQAGPVLVNLQSVPPPRAPVPSTPQEMEEFRTTLATRPSRFPDDPAGFRNWQGRYRDKLAGWLMNGSRPQRVPLDARVSATEERGAFALRTIEYRSHSDRVNAALLALPKDAVNVPLLLALHGHEAEWGQADRGAFTAGHADDFCAYFAERGWAVLQPATMNHTLQHPGWTLQGEWTWDAMVALDYALTVPGIDAVRVGVCGLSTGGHLAMNVLALDDRVRAGVNGCVLSTWHHYAARMVIPPHCDCGIRQQLSPQLEQCDWAALAAPKPVQVQHGKQDVSFCPGAPLDKLELAWQTGVMPQAEYDALFAEVHRAYRLAGTPAHAATCLHEQGHRVDSAAACQFLSQHLHETNS